MPIDEAFWQKVQQGLNEKRAFWRKFYPEMGPVDPYEGAWLLIYQYRDEKRPEPEPLADELKEWLQAEAWKMGEGMFEEEWLANEATDRELLGAYTEAAASYAMGQI